MDSAFHSQVWEIQMVFSQGIIAETLGADKNMYHLIKIHNFMVSRFFSLILQMSYHRPLCLVSLMDSLAFSSHYFKLLKVGLLNEIIALGA